MIFEIYKLDIIEQDRLVYLLKILAFNFSDCEIHPFTLETEILIIVSSKKEIIKDRFLTSIKSEGFNCELLKASL